MTETETARVIRAFKTVQPDFDQHFFLKEVANYIIADLLEAYLSADVQTLKEWGTEGVWIFCLHISCIFMASYYFFRVPFRHSLV